LVSDDNDVNGDHQQQQQQQLQQHFESAPSSTEAADAMLAVNDLSVLL